MNNMQQQPSGTPPPQMPPMPAKSGKPWWVWVAAAAVIVLAGLAAWRYVAEQPAEVPSEESPAPLSGGDTTADIAEDLEALDIGNVEEELDRLDADINQL